MSLMANVFLACNNSNIFSSNICTFKNIIMCLSHPSLIIRSFVNLPWIFWFFQVHIHVCVDAQVICRSKIGGGVSCLHSNKHNHLCWEEHTRECTIYESWSETWGTCWDVYQIERCCVLSMIMKYDWIEMKFTMWWIILSTLWGENRSRREFQQVWPQGGFSRSTDRYGRPTCGLIVWDRKGMTDGCGFISIVCFDAPKKCWLYLCLLVWYLCAGVGEGREQRVVEKDVFHRVVPWEQSVRVSRGKGKQCLACSRVVTVSSSVCFVPMEGMCFLKKPKRVYYHVIRVQREM